MSATTIARLTSAVLLVALCCGCHTTQRPTAPAPSSSATSTTPSVAPAPRIAPLPVRPVQKSQPSAPDKCPAVNLPHAHIAFVRDDLVLEAPMIENQVTSGQIALTTQTAPAAAQLAQLAGRPA
ncbi:hypothetical protein [Mycobacterium genavense]|uniref:hypothetical protein n=1 Tax=Mycobacterium genavense TaxID=36812 RepID=UPI00146FBF2A|nr:hypothetical protein [Mycobacterium genavense]